MKARRKMISRLVLATLLASAGAAPVATAMPVKDTPYYSSKAYAPSAAQTRHARQHGQAARGGEPGPALGGVDRRACGGPRERRQVRPAHGGDALHACGRPGERLKSDLRTEAAADPSRAPKTPIGMPTWPVNPQPIVPPPRSRSPLTAMAATSTGRSPSWPWARSCSAAAS